jgi:hypothetical protein
LNYDSKFVGGKLGTGGNNRSEADARKANFAFKIGSGRVVRGLKIASKSFGTGKTRGMEK